MSGDASLWHTLFTVSHIKSKDKGTGTARDGRAEGHKQEMGEGGAAQDTKEKRRNFISKT